MSKSRFQRLLEKVIKILLNIVKIFSRSKFQIIFYKYLKYIGINLKGKPQYISSDVFLDEVDYSLITFNNNIVISREVTILVHDYSISRAIVAIEGNIEKEKYIAKEVYIDENSFIGAKSILLPGTKIGKNTIIGAGSVVKGEIPDNVVAAGNPCKIICSIEDYYTKQIKENFNYIRVNK